jgi:hypothetical protein
MSRRFIVPGAVAVVALAALATYHPAQAATPSPRGAACELSGTATISPGLTTSARTQTVTLKGVKLTNCESGAASQPGVPKPTTGTVTVPAVTSKASCASGNLALTASIVWSNGTRTTAKVNTTGVLVNQAIKGTATSSTNPAIKAGDLVGGDAVFKPVSPTQNCVKVPVTAVTFTGVLGVGSPK